MLIPADIPKTAGTSLCNSFLIEQAKRRLGTWIAKHILARSTVKIHGLLRVGTNYMQALITKNFNAECLDAAEGGWKHGPCNYESKKKYVFLLKNPYSWLVSFRDWEVIHNRSTARDLAEFISQPLSHTRLRDEWGVRVRTPVEAWNVALGSWLSLYGKPNTIFVRYEDLINDFHTCLIHIEERLNLNRIKPAFANMQARADNWDTPNLRKPLNIYYYINEEYMQEYNSESISILKERLDAGIMARIGYRLY